MSSLDQALLAASYHQSLVKDAPTASQTGQGILITMDVKGQKSGVIDGSHGKAVVKGHEKAFHILYCQHQVISPRDPHSGLPTGQRMHKPVEVVGRNCKGVPQLWQVLCTNENCSEVKISFWSRTEAGAGKTAAIEYTIKLTNANIASMDHMTSETDGTFFYRVQFTYQSIEWEWAAGNIMARDDWEVKI